MISAVSNDFHVMWGTGSPAVAIEHCHNPHTRPDALVLDMALGKKSRALTCASASVAGAAGRAACSRTCTAWPTSWESPAARRCWTHAPDTICSAPAFRPAWPAACRASGDRGVLRRIVRGGARGVRVLDGGTGPRHRDRARYHVGSGCACRPGRRHVPPGPVPVAGACHGRNPHAGCPDGHAGTDGMPADEHEYQ